ncbi:MAG: YlmH/Sll1252 family protein [Lachnospiraceae bacterium]
MALGSEKELQQFKNRLKDLARKSFNQNMYTFTPMLGMMEQTIFWNMIEELSYAGYEVYGGRENAERVMIRFGNPVDFGYEEEFPITLIHMKPLLAKFSDNFSHRDFLGALMNLGIDRGLLGDIIVLEKQGYLFCQTPIADFICDTLQKVKHTNIKCVIATDLQEYEEAKPTPEEHNVASERLDVLVASIYNLSRSKSILLFREKKIFVSGRLCENNSRVCKEGEVIQVRGFGKFFYDGIGLTTKKGKYRVRVRVFR